MYVVGYVMLSQSSWKCKDLSTLLH